MKWPFERKPKVTEVVKAVFELLTEEEMQRMYDPEDDEADRDIRKVIERCTPNQRAQHSMEKCLRIAKEELEVIKEMPLLTARKRMIRMFGVYLF